MVDRPERADKAAEEPSEEEGQQQDPDGPEKTLYPYVSGEERCQPDEGIQLEEEVSKYIKIKEGIWLKEKELQEIYEIEKNASTLTALLEAQVQKRTEFENEMRERKDAFESMK